MGGNALKEFGAQRLPTARVNQIAAEVLDVLTVLKGGPHFAQTIESYRAKPDHGDLDIVLSQRARENLSPQQLVQALSTALQVPTMPFVANGPVLSFGYPLAEGVFQVDLIFVPDATLDFAVKYFAWNDLGNLIGRVAHKMGLSFGHQGLLLPMRDGNNLFATLTLTTDFAQALTFLGFDYDRWLRGFDQVEDIYEFVVGGHGFNAEIYLLENRNHTARVRDRKRPTYTGFLTWLEHQTDLRAFNWTGDKDRWLPLVFDGFPHVKAEYDAARAGMARKKEVSLKYGGLLISRVTGLSGKDLGVFKRKFELSLGTEEQALTWLHQADGPTIENAVHAFHITLQENSNDQ